MTNHAIVAMVEADVKRTRCTTCDSEHEYKHAKVPHQRRKAETPAALYSQVLANAPKKIVHESGGSEPPSVEPEAAGPASEDVASERESPGDLEAREAPEGLADEAKTPGEAEAGAPPEAEGPVHRRLIRATLPRADGQPPPQRPIPEFTIRQPGGRPNRFRPRQGRGGGQSFQNNRPTGAGGGQSRSGRPHGSGRQRQGHGRKRSK